MKTVRDFSIRTTLRVPKQQVAPAMLHHVYALISIMMVRSTAESERRPNTLLQKSGILVRAWQRAAARSHGNFYPATHDVIQFCRRGDSQRPGNGL
jgi:hypothetical protein